METNIVKLKIAAFIACLAATAGEAYPDWTSFRNGGTSTVDGELPISWTPESQISWQVELPGYGQSTPVIVGDHVYVASVVGPMKEQCLVQCISLAGGSEVWRYEFDATVQAASNYMASRAAPTPVADNGGVVVFFESGDIVSLTSSGDRRWHRDLTQDLGKLENNHGLGSSPTQNASHIFVNVEHKGPSHLVAIDKASGEIAWKAGRPSGSSWSSPIVGEVGGVPQVIVSSAGTVTAYAASTGKELWRVDGLDGNSVPSPTLHQQKLFIGARLPEFASKGSVKSNCCVDLSNDQSAPTVAWRADRAISDYASPVAVGSYVYFVSKVGVLHCIDGESGKLHYRQRLSGECWATPVVSGNRVYFFAKDGTTEVIEAGDTFKLLATSQLWDADNPPKPEMYVENNSRGGHGHGAGEGGPPKSSTGGSTESGRPGGGMMAAMMRGDKNGDGSLSAEEVPADFKPMLARIDTNGDGALDPAELKAMADSFAKRRADSQAGARDPIVYGAVASGKSIVVRTGTRLFCIRDN